MEGFVLKELTVVGIGPGTFDGMTAAAAEALEGAEIIVGYTAYCDLVKP